MADPVLEELVAMSQRIEELEREVQKLSQPNDTKERTA